jgi:hypothetical protein
MLALMQQQYAVDEALYGKRYAGAMDWVKAGQGAAGTMGALQAPYATGMAGTMGTMGQNVAGGTMAQAGIWGNYMQQMGQQQGETASTIGSIMASRG